jgi:hypothetical protein
MPWVSIRQLPVFSVIDTCQPAARNARFSGLGSRIGASSNLAIRLFFTAAASDVMTPRSRSPIASKRREYQAA